MLKFTHFEKCPQHLPDLNPLGQDLGPDFLECLNVNIRQKGVSCDPDWLSLLASLDGVTVGTTGIYKDVDRYWIAWTGVLHPYRGLGYGRELIRAAEHLAYKRARSLYLYCGKENQAFYEKLGYTCYKLPKEAKAKSQEGFTAPGWDGAIMRKVLIDPNQIRLPI